MPRFTLLLQIAVLTAVTLALGAGPAAGQPGPLAGPKGTSLNKVLVIGTDGTRWDLLKEAMRSGRAPNLARLRRLGFGRPSLLEFAPTTFTLSEVGWSSIASGVWEDKHGIDGSRFNMDPGQATKNGYLDFLTRIEQSRPQLSTFLASDWDNIGLAENGGPIFGSAMDANFAARVSVETIEAWDTGDEQVTRAASRYLRRGDPDAGFVYLGLVDETAHLAGSATPTYARAITTMDARVGRILEAVRTRPAYPFESWTVLVTTDHGQKPLMEPSIVSHFGDTPLERTTFVLGAGPGLAGPIPAPRVVDILPTVLHQLGLPTRTSWNIDGRSIASAPPPSSASAELVARRRLVARLTFGGGLRRARALAVRLPEAARKARARVNGRRAPVRAAGRTLVVRLGGRRLRSLSLDARLHAPPRPDGRLRVTLLGRGGARLGALRVPLER